MLIGLAKINAKVLKFVSSTSAVHVKIFCLKINLSIILALILANLLTAKLLLDLYFLFHSYCVFIQCIKALPFALLIEKKIKVLAVLKSCDTAKHVSIDGQQFFKKSNKIFSCVHCLSRLYTDVFAG